jgi:hypothetical protein
MSYRNHDARLPPAVSYRPQAERAPWPRAKSRRQPARRQLSQRRRTHTRAPPARTAPTPTSADPPGNAHGPQPHIPTSADPLDAALFALTFRTQRETRANNSAFVNTATGIRSRYHPRGYRFFAAKRHIRVRSGPLETARFRPSFSPTYHPLAVRRRHVAAAHRPAATSSTTNHTVSTHIEYHRGTQAQQVHDQRGPPRHRHADPRADTAPHGRSCAVGGCRLVDARSRGA